MEWKHLATALLCLQVLASSAVPEQTNVIGLIGGVVTLRCDLPTSETPQIAWKDLVWNQRHGKEPIFNSTESMDVAATHLIKDSMTVDGEYALTIENLLFGNEDDNEHGVSSSGDYFCYSLYEGKWHEQKFFLSMADKPTCTGSVDLSEGESTEITCSAQYSGNMPDLQWFRNGQKVAVNPSPTIGEARSVIDINGATYMENEAIYTCRMSVGEKNEECQQTLSVKYKVRDMKLGPMDDVIHIGQEIRCSARGNPAPQIVFDQETNSAYSGKGFRAMTVDESWLNQMTTVSCNAENSFEGKVEIIEKSITFNVTVPKVNPVTGDATHNSVSILAFVSTIFGIVFAALF